MDIYFRHDNRCFNFRVAAVIKKEDKILLSKFGNIFTLPGGRVKFSETTERAIKREVLEELNVNVKITKLLSINENFFEYGDDNYHEVLFVYLCEIDNEVDLKNINKNTTSIEKFVFVSLNDILDLNFKPEFLLNDLKKLSNTIIHNVNK